ncbi:MAG: hypothetical protein D5S00_00185 [Tindallia sp. MSAO_Bac2]|nr:MAG: hypothetical protein D5S00_00185 [Tindallia sp. MSAO_Bac2]
MKILITAGYQMTEAKLDRFRELGCNPVVWSDEKEPVSEEEALLDHLNQNGLRAAALDVFHEEPLPEKSPLWDHPKIIATPHASFLSTSVPDRAFELAYRNIKAFMEGKPMENQQL